MQTAGWWAIGALLVGLSGGYYLGDHYAQRYELHTESHRLGSGEFSSTGVRVYVLDRKTGAVQTLNDKGQPLPATP